MLNFDSILEEANYNYRTHVVSNSANVGRTSTQVSKEVEIMGKAIVDALNNAIVEANEGDEEW